MSHTKSIAHGRTASHGPQDLFEYVREAIICEAFAYIENGFKIHTKHRCLLGGEGEICV